MAKRQLHQLRVRAAAYTSRKLGGRKLVIRPITDANTSDTDLLSSGSTELDDSTRTTGQKEPKTPDKRKRGFWRWWLVWLFAVGILGGTGVIGGLLLTTLPPPTDCDRISPLAPDSERLNCAELAAQSGKLDRLVAAIAVASSWPENHPLYSQSQRRLEEWSQTIMAIAQQKMNQGDLKTAIAVVRKIPVNSPIYPDAQAKIADWQQDWKRGERIANSVRDALKEQQWLTASKQAQGLLLLNIDYWRTSRFDELMKLQETEKQAWRQLQEARELARSKTPIELDRAIALAGKIPDGTYVKQVAQADKNEWNRALVKIAAERFKEQDFAGVVVVLQRVPAEASVYAEAQDWIRLSSAEYAAQHPHMLALIEALSAVRQINEQSPLYSQALARKSLWQSHLQDEVQLQFASSLASLEQQMTLRLAIDQAGQIGPSRPGRVQAQTLIASWRKELQQIDDRSTLVAARQLALPGTVESLKTAVKRANEIKLGQPLRVEAQTAIAQWNRQIQILEDQPILDLARAFALKGDFIAAVGAVQQIRPDRALYSEAQTAASEWTEKVQIFQDQPILKAAIALAAQGRLDAAIQTASQIGSGRPLYKEAQSSILGWQSQLDTAKAERDRAAASVTPQEENLGNQENRFVDTN